ncbi:hypothetical protein LDENG_00297130 [Lucifuga dentata]|nr:hypothetical protein LDENG_00297130 [Lucifuga dentata]
MKLEGVMMESTEPIEAAAVAEPSSSQGVASQDNITEQTQTQEVTNAAAPPAAQEANGEPAATDPKVKPKAVTSKKQPMNKTAGASGSTSRPAASSTVKNQAKVPDKKPVGAARNTSVAAATVTNSKPTANSTPKKKAEAVNGARAKNTVPASRPAASTVPKPTTSTTAKPDRAAASSKTARPATGPSTSRPTSTTSRPTTAATKPSATATAKAAASRVTTAPSTGRTTAAQVPKTVAAKKDVSRPASATVAKKPTTATTSAATKKPEPSKATATLKLSAASKRPAPAKAPDPKPSQSKTQEPPKPAATKEHAAASARSSLRNKPLQGRTPPDSPANKPVGSRTPQAKRGPKPTQAVPPFTAIKKTGVPNSTTLVEAPSAEVAVTTAATVPAESRAEATVALPQESSLGVFAPEEAPSQILAQDTTSEVVLEETVRDLASAPSPPQNPVRTAFPQSSPAQDHRENNAASLTTQEQITGTVEAIVPTVASPPELPEPVYLATAQTSCTSKALPSAADAMPQRVPPSNLNEEEDDEEREGSQQVSVSEMSGTTQPTEESRPGSAGPLGGSAWRVGGALLSELDSEEVSGSQQGASELSAPGVLEGTESMDDLGDGSLKGAIDMEGASAGSPDFEKVPDIPVNDFEEDEDDEDDDDDRVCDMDVGSEWADDPLRTRHDNDVDDEEDEDVEMASEGVTESGLESYGNADEDDFAEDERLDNLNRVVQPPPPPPLLPSAPAAQWDQPNQNSTPEELGEYDQEGCLQPPAQAALSLQANQDQTLGIHLESGDREGEEADEITGGPASGPTSNPSSSSVTEDEASDTEGEAQLDDPLDVQVINNITFNSQPPTTRCLSTVEEGEEVELEGMEGGIRADTSPPSADSVASCGFDTMTSASNSNAQSTGESCSKSPGIFSLEELPEEAKDPCLFQQPQSTPCLAEQDYIQCGKQEAEPAEDTGEEVLGSEETLDPSTPNTLQQPEEKPDDTQPPYYSAICEKTENSFAGFTALPHPHRRDHAAYPRSYCDIIKPHGGAVTPPKLTCTDLPPRSPGQQALSPQLRRLEQHQRQLLEMQQRREQQNRPIEEAEQERKRREEEEQRKKREEAEEEIKRNKEEEERRMQEQADVMKREEEKMRKEEELKQRRDLELQLQQQQQELKQRQQIMQWQQELQQSNKGQTVLLSPSSGLCTIYEALENSDEEGESEEEMMELKPTKNQSKGEPMNEEKAVECVKAMSDEDKPLHSPPSSQSSPPLPDFPQIPRDPSQDEDISSSCPPESPERPPPLDLDWGKKVDIVQQLINQTLLLNGDGCSSLLLLPGGGTLSPLESSLWPSLLPPLTPPSATVTSVSSFSPEATGSSPQGEWTVVELETHH